MSFLCNETPEKKRCFQRSCSRITQLRCLTYLAFIAAVFFAVWLSSFSQNLGSVTSSELSSQRSRFTVIQHWNSSVNKLPYSCLSHVTIVTAYFNLQEKSKHSESDFLSWNSKFFGLQDNMVIFTDMHTSSHIKDARSFSNGCTVVFEQDVFYSELGNTFDWLGQHLADPERDLHSPELYIIWNQKSLWLADVSTSNPFHSSHFFWADSGQFREEKFLDAHISAGENWITAYNIFPPCKIALLAIEKFRPGELIPIQDKDGLPLSSMTVRIGGGNFGGDSCAVKKWRSAFLQMMDLYRQHDAFFGKDQPLYGSTCISNKDLCFLVDGSHLEGIHNIWFGMQPVLHGIIQPVQYTI